MSRYYRLRGREVEPTDLMGWAQSFGDGDARRVAKTQVGQRTVSTVFLGNDHSFGDGPPLIFETMVFDLDVAQSGCWRYSTYAEAELGHRQVVEALQGAVVT